MRYLIFTLLLFGLSFVYAQNEFPDQWLGTWKGELSWYTPGAKTPQKVAMEIRISPVRDSVDQFHWEMVYAGNYDAVRAYVLQSVDKSKGKWMIDEKNGILLEQFLYGDHLTGVFSIEGSTIVNSYRVEQDIMIVEFTSFRLGSGMSSGGQSEDIPTVESYTVNSFQRAVLKKS